MTVATSTPIVIDLIGDLDTTLVASLSEMLHAFTSDGPREILLCARHLALTSHDALTALGAALENARGRGASIAIDPGNRKMRLAFGEAHIDHSGVDVPRPSRARHYMMARHAEKRHLLVA